MKTSRPLLLVTSSLVMVFLLGGGLLVKVVAAEGSYRQAVLFAEILSQVLDNYVDEIEPGGLLEGAYEGMLGGLDANGAFLSEAEVSEWKAQLESGSGSATPGVTVLKTGRSLQIVSVTKGSAAEEAGISVGDQIRLVDGVAVRNLSLTQARYRIAGDAGSTVKVELLHPHDGFRREEVELERRLPGGRSYSLTVDQGTAVLRLLTLEELPLDEVIAELDDVESRPVDRLLIDLRNLAGANPRSAARVAALFTPTRPLLLRDRDGELVESVGTEPHEPAWSGSIAVLVNGGTAEGAEALALLLGERPNIQVFGEKTFGLGAEPEFYQLDDGSALLLSSALWETSDGETWHEKGVEPDEQVKGEGENFAEAFANQLELVLQRMAGVEAAQPEPEREAA